MGIRCWGGEGLQCRMTKPITHLVALRSTVLCQWLRSASSTSPFRCARPQVVQKLLDHRLTEWSLLIILDKFKQGCFSTDHSPPITLAFPCLFLLFSTVPTSSNSPTKSTGTGMRLGCLFVQDVTVRVTVSSYAIVHCRVTDGTTWRHE